MMARKRERERERERIPRNSSIYHTHAICMEKGEQPQGHTIRIWRG